MSIYSLPELDYDYTALEPVISRDILELHHSKHHAAYVKGANDTYEALQTASGNGSLSGSIVGLTKTFSFNLGGHLNHTIYWKNLSPQGGGEPTGPVADAIVSNFGSFESFKKYFTAAAMTVQGSGWAGLFYDTVAQKLLTLQISDHHENIPAFLVPLIMIDMWEHSFYLQYKNVKADYVNAIWDILNWSDISERYNKAVSGLVTV